MSWYDNPLLKNCKKIHIHDMKKEIYLGFHPKEKEQPQLVLFTAQIFVEDMPTQDKIENTYDYDEFERALDKILLSQPFALQEALLDALAKEVLKNSLVKAILLSSKKPAAYPNATYASIEIFRTQSHD